ncbi:hypothetical protein JCM13664_21650 [Methylothermus subterraneus]
MASGIKREQVWQAAQALLDEGHKPTIQAIRQRLGGGSYTTLCRHLAEWRETQRPQPEHPPVPESVREIAQRLWAEAWRLAEERRTREQAQWMEERKRLEQEIRDLALELERKDKAFQEALAKLEDSLRRRMEKEIALEYQKAETERLQREKNEATERQRVLERENAALAQKLDDAAGEIARLQTELAAARQRETRALEQAARLQAALESKTKRGGK